VGVWTVNDPAEAADLVALGVRTLITDAPGALLDALSLRS
jgi:glycerophosphoryl diester phosphodiesterase